MGRFSVALIALLAMLLFPRVATAGGPCSNPRSAVDSVFKYQKRRNTNLDKASACFESEGRTAAQLRQSAKHIKLVYDALGAKVKVDKISKEADYLDSDKEPRVIPHETLDDVWVEKRGDKWLWTKESLDNIDERFVELGTLYQFAGKLPTFFHNVEIVGVKLWQYLSLLLLVVLGLVVRKMIAVVVAPRLKKWATKMEQTWPEKFVDVIASPGATLLTAIVLRIGYPQLLLPVAWSTALAGTVRVLITVSLVWAAYRAVDVLAARLADRAEATESKLDDQLVPLLRKTLKVIVVVIGTLVAMQNLDFDVTTLFASVSIGGLALGLAAKDTLANLFGSISIFVDSPFQIGDWINVQGVDGTVEEVGFRSTRLGTFYNSVVVLPNAKIADAKIDNYGQREYRRVFTKLGLTYDTSPEQMQAFVEGVRAIILANEYTRKDTYEVHFSAFNDSALEVMLYFFFKCDTWTEELRERHNVYLEIMRLANDIGVSFAFPTQSLHVESLVPPMAPPEMRGFDRRELRAKVHSFGPEGDASQPTGPRITKGGYVAKTLVKGDGDG